MNLQPRKPDLNTNKQYQSTTAKSVRCAIYTRKSTTEGLDSDFSTLVAQRESCEAYVLSQKGQGWSALPERFDDGGFTGSNMNRPALQKLIVDVEAGKVDCIVVYKIDRISRSLADFSNLVVFLEKHNVSFISITQSFNTSDSAGRLMMNILLSFAQYERELIADRTRDKMCGARRKGKWIGGIPMLGYDIHQDGGKLIVNQEEEALVKEIFRLYLELQSLLELAGELNRRGWTTIC